MKFGEMKDLQMKLTEEKGVLEEYYSLDNRISVRACTDDGRVIKQFGIVSISQQVCVCVCVMSG